MVEMFGIAVADRTQSALAWAGLALVFMFLLDRYKLARREAQQGNTSTLRLFFGLLRAQIIWSYSRITYVLWPMLWGTIGFLFPDPAFIAFVFNGLGSLDPFVSGLLAGALGAGAGLAGFDLRILGVNLISVDYVVGIAFGVTVAMAVLRGVAALSGEGDDD